MKKSFPGRKQIYNPETNRWVFIDGAVGKRLIKKYGRDNLIGNNDRNQVGEKYTDIVIYAHKYFADYSNEGVHHPEYRSAMGHAVDSDLIEINGCDINEVIENFRMLKDGGGVSESVQGIARLSNRLKYKKNISPAFRKALDDSNKKIFLKIYQPEKDPQDNSLEIEDLIYDKLTKHMIKNNYTPHIITHIDSIQCNADTMVLKLGSLIADDDDRRHFSNIFIEMGIKMDQKLRSMVLEQSLNTQTLNDIFSKDKNITNLTNLLFQLLYTLEVFNRYGLRHNDLHFNNIWVEKTTDEIKYYYVINDSNKIKVYHVPSNYIVKIFDFDRSSLNENKINHFKQFVNINNNALPDYYCQSNMQCNTKDPKFDTYKLFAEMIFYSPLSSNIMNFVNKYMPNELYNIKNDYLFPMLHDDINGLPIKKNQKIYNKMNNTLHILNDPLFDQFLVKNKVRCTVNTKVYVLPGIDRSKLKDYFTNINNYNIRLVGYSKQLGTLSDPIKRIDYFKQLKNVSVIFRSILIKWLIDLLTLKSPLFVIVMTVDIYDRFMSKKLIDNKGKIQLIGVSCLIIALHFYDNYNQITYDRASYFTDYTYTKNEIRNMVKQIYQTFNNDVYYPEIGPLVNVIKNYQNRLGAKKLLFDFYGTPNTHIMSYDDQLKILVDLLYSKTIF